MVIIRMYHLPVLIMHHLLMTMIHLILLRKSLLGHYEATLLQSGGGGFDTVLKSFGTVLPYLLVNSTNCLMVLLAGSLYIHLLMKLICLLGHPIAKKVYQKIFIMHYLSF